MSRKDSEFRLGQLSRELDEVAAELKKAQAEASSLQRSKAALEKERMEIVEAMSTAKDDITVSDHALLRYLERRYGYKFEEYRAEILTDSVVSAIKCGATSIKVGGVQMRVKNNTVVTVV